MQPYHPQSRLVNNYLLRIISAMKTQNARELLGCATDSDLAQVLGVTRQAVCRWGGEIPQGRRWQIELMLLKKKSPPMTAGFSQQES